MLSPYFISYPPLYDLWQGSILDFNWTADGDVVFANSTCFDDSLMLKMSKMAEGLKPGSIFVTFTKGLVTPGECVIGRLIPC
jgi:hypothetical protein